ncbi:MAG: acylphosphatase [Actinomycetota bacterium]|nr:acylphosphatase [Actinomycetota bacterium]
MGIVRARVRIEGRVQGVFFRAETLRVARMLSLGGWVRNMPGGSVEAVFEGDEEKVKAGIEWCRKGPSHARVEKVSISWEEPLNKCDFEILY